MPEIKHVFFDLDHTLWNFSTNSREAIAELYERHELVNRGIKSFERFYEVYVEVNERYWTLYRVGKMSKKVLRKIRFQSTFERFGVMDLDLGAQFGEDYISLSPYKTALFPQAHETLTYLKDKGYQLHIITNGFEEVQKIKLEQSKLRSYFNEVITSEAVEARKPNPLIYEHAFKRCGAKADESIMIGDSLEADVLGALAMGMKAVFFNPEKKSHEQTLDHEIVALDQLREIL